MATPSLDRNKDDDEEDVESEEEEEDAASPGRRSGLRPKRKPEPQIKGTTEVPNAYKSAVKKMGGRRSEREEEEDDEEDDEEEEEEEMDLLQADKKVKDLLDDTESEEDDNEKDDEEDDEKDEDNEQDENGTPQRRVKNLVKTPTPHMMAKFQNAKFSKKCDSCFLMQAKCEGTAPCSRCAARFFRSNPQVKSTKGVDPGKFECVYSKLPEGHTPKPKSFTHNEAERMVLKLNYTAKSRPTTTKRSADDDSGSTPAVAHLRLFHVLTKDDDMIDNLQQRNDAPETFWSGVAQTFQDADYEPESIGDVSIHKDFAIPQTLELSMIGKRGVTSRYGGRKLRSMFEESRMRLLDTLKSYQDSGTPGWDLSEESDPVFKTGERVKRAKNSGAQPHLLYLWYLFEEHELMDALNEESVGSGTDWMTNQNERKGPKGKKRKREVETTIPPPDSPGKGRGGSRGGRPRKSTQPALSEEERERKYRDAVLFYSTMAEKITALEDTLIHAKTPSRRSRIEERLEFMEEQMNVAKVKVDQFKKRR